MKCPDSDALTPSAGHQLGDMPGGCMQCARYVDRWRAVNTVSTALALVVITGSVTWLGAQIGAWLRPGPNVVVPRHIPVRPKPETPSGKSGFFQAETAPVQS